MRQSQPRRVTVVRYVLPDGTRVKKGTPGAKRLREKSDTYYAKVGGKRISLNTSDLAQAWANLRTLLRRERDREAGIADDRQEHAAKPLSDHLATWRQAVLDGGASEAQAALLYGRMTALADLVGWKRLPDLTADSLRAALAKLQKVKGRSAQTRNHYLTHARQFANWCVESDRLPKNPFLGVKPVSVEADRRHDRRCPSPEEMARLFAYLDGPTAKRRKGMTGPQRALGYLVSASTGFRAGELRSLTRESFDLDAGTATVEAAYSKRGRRDVQPLPAWLVERLRTWFDGGGDVWDNFRASVPGRTLQADLKAAGVPYVVQGQAGPLFFDFHALRHYFCTEIANQPSMSPKLMMELTRHSTPALALKTYAKARGHEKRAAADQIPPPGS